MIHVDEERGEGGKHPPSQTCRPPFRKIMHKHEEEGETKQALPHRAAISTVDSASRRRNSSADKEEMRELMLTHFTAGLNHCHDNMERARGWWGW